MPEKTRYNENEFLKTKTKIWFVDTEESIKILAIEKFKNKDLEIHHPFNWDYEQKYKNIETIEYVGFKGTLPRGCSKSTSRGLGFTKILGPVIKHLDEELKPKKIVVKPLAKNVFDEKSKIITISANTLDQLFVVLKAHFDAHSEKTKALAENELSKILPKFVEPKETKYIKNSVHAFLKNLEPHYSNFSELDIGTLMIAVEEASDQVDFAEIRSLLKTREKIEELYIEDVIEEFSQLMEQVTDTKTLENKWQDFLKSHTWIFSYVLSLPVILHEKEAYVGGKRVSNTGGKVTDFLIKNDLSKNVAFVELKTHLTDLMLNKPYRGDNLYAPSKELTGATNQALNQRDNFQKEFWALKGKSAADFLSLNSKCVVLAGMLDNLDQNQLESFELFRGNSKDVLIITFDELLARLENLLSIMSENKG